MNAGPVNPPRGPRYALVGRVVTMDADYRVFDPGVVYIDAGGIAAVGPAGMPAPPAFTGITPFRTGGTIYPGLIDLHNHLPYDILPRWNVPRAFTNRAQWSRTPDYARLISGPMGVLGRTPGCVEAIVRYVEAKCLLSGVTTTQGIALFSNQGARRYYRGIVRNVEETGEADLPEASTRISDVEAGEAARFLARLHRSTCLLLHLSEGVDEEANRHFRSLLLPGGAWAITPALAGIHCTGLRAEDFLILQTHGGAMIWSPLSNLALYGATAGLGAAKASGLRIGIGADWSPTGSKNLLGELKAARLVSTAGGGILTDREILALATRNAAEILGWERALGTVEAGKRADLLVLAGQTGDPYAGLLESNEAAVRLVVINGTPRYGTPGLMRPFGPATETWRVAGRERLLNLAQSTADPAVGALTLQAARDRLAGQMRDLPGWPRCASGNAQGPGRLDGVCFSTTTDWLVRLSGRTCLGGRRPGRSRPARLRGSLVLDPLTAVDDPDLFAHIAGAINLPAYIKEGLPRLY